MMIWILLNYLCFPDEPDFLFYTIPLQSYTKAWAKPEIIYNSYFPINVNFSVLPISSKNILDSSDVCAFYIDKVC